MVVTEPQLRKAAIHVPVHNIPQAAANPMFLTSSPILSIAIFLTTGLQIQLSFLFLR